MAKYDVDRSNCDGQREFEAIVADCIESEIAKRLRLTVDSGLSPWMPIQASLEHWSRYMVSIYGKQAAIVLHTDIIDRLRNNAIDGS